MITWNELVDRIFAGLEETLDDMGGITVGNDTWRFAMLPDTGKLTPARRTDNGVTRFIDINAQCLDSDIDTPKGGIVSADITLSLDLRVPILQATDANGNELIVQQVRNVLDAYFAENKSGTMTGKDGMTYVYGAAYGLSMTGVRDVVPGIGDSIGFHVSAEFSLLQNGAAAELFSLKIDGYDIPYALFGLSRTADPEPGLQAVNGNFDPTGTAAWSGATGSVSSGTTFAINVSMPWILMQSGAAGESPLNRFLPVYAFLFGLEKNMIYHYVQIEAPDGNGDITIFRYSMIFTEQKGQVEPQRPSSLTFSMQEADVSSGQYTLAPQKGE